MRRGVVAVMSALLVLASGAVAFGADAKVTISNFWCKASGYYAVVGEDGNAYMDYREWDAGFNQMWTRTSSTSKAVTTSVTYGTAVFTVSDGAALPENTYAVIDGDPWIPCDGAKHYHYAFDVTWTSNTALSYLTLCLEPLAMWQYSPTPHIAQSSVTLRRLVKRVHVTGNLNGAPGIRFCLSNIQHPVVPEPSSVVALIGGIAGMVGWGARKKK